MSISDHCLDAVPFEPETLRLASRRNHPVAGWRWLTPTVMTLVTALLAAASYAAETPVFKDRNLEKAVRKFVFEKRDSDKPLVEADLVDLSTVQAGGMGITDLAGLEKCPNLASLDLSQNKILDLRPLQTLVKLEYLNLATNQVSDLAPLAGIASLQYIELSHNRVKELRPLATLTNLASLYLGNNRIDDLAPLLKLPRLTSLYLDNNRVRSIQGIDVLKALSTLSLSHNAIEDLAPLQGLTGLSYLFLENNRIRELTPLIEMAKKDFEGEKRFAPFLNIYLKGNRVKRADASRLAAVGPRLND